MKSHSLMNCQKCGEFREYNHQCKLPHNPDNLSPEQYGEKPLQDFSFESVNDFVHGSDISFEGMQGALLKAATQIQTLSQQLAAVTAERDEALEALKRAIVINEEIITHDIITHSGKHDTRDVVDVSVARRLGMQIKALREQLAAVSAERDRMREALENVLKWSQETGYGKPMEIAAKALGKQLEGEL